MAFISPYEKGRAQSSSQQIGALFVLVESSAVAINVALSYKNRQSMIWFMRFTFT